MKYEEKITCFIDLMGFKAAICESIKKDDVRERLYEVIHELKSNKILNEVYGRIPFYSLDRENTIKPSSEVFGSNLIEQFSDSIPLTITQFSDSFVLSCPAENRASCEFLLQSVYMINLMFFHNLGMMVRGGISKGLLLHEEVGALFGPSMNEAHELESKVAIYPRIVVSKTANEHLHSLLDNKSPLLIPFKKSNDDHIVIDLISIFAWPRAEYNPDKIESQLKLIEADILETSEKAHPKIAYLMDQWDTFRNGK